MSLVLRSCHASERGTRHRHNEDRFVDRPDLGVWAVADGAGGHAAGELASGLVAAALEAIPAGLNAQAVLAQIRGRIGAVHADVLAEAAGRGADVTIASTAVILCVRDEHFVCLWAGDSRAYRLARGELQQITRDHSLVQELVDAGEITREQAEKHPNANVITRAVGASGEVLELDMVTGAVRDGDRFLLCTDGLSKAVDDAALAGILRADGPHRAADRLLAAALAHKARDNVTAVVLEVAGDGPL